MRKRVINENMLIEAGKEILRKDGIEAINMRSIARCCQVSAGSIYNYYLDKDELLLAIVKSIWQEIAHGKKIEADSFVKTVSSLFDSIAEGNRIYPDFLKIHFICFADRMTSRIAMEELVRNIKSILLNSLNEDKNVKNIFDDDFNKSKFVNFVFENVMTLLLKNEEKDYLLKLISNLLYEN